MEITKDLYSQNIDKQLDRINIESEYKNTFKEIIDNDKRLNLEAKREQDNIKTLEQIVKLDNQAKQAFKEAKDLKITSYKNFTALNNQRKAQKSKELESKDYFDKRNKLLGEFNKYKNVMSDKVKETEVYCKAKDINDIQIKHLQQQKEREQEKQIDSSMGMEFDYD